MGISRRSFLEEFKRGERTIMINPQPTYTIKEIAYIVNRDYHQVLKWIRYYPKDISLKTSGEFKNKHTSHIIRYEDFIDFLNRNHVPYKIKETSI